jgi:hypothetical protein
MIRTHRSMLHTVASALLDGQHAAHTLRPEVVELAALLTNSATIDRVRPDDISVGESQTPNGLALSPTMAAMCADDFARTIGFIRGTHAAIVDSRRRLPDRPARVLYVGCGPYATLAVPLMAVFSPGEATFTLLDIHSDSIESARSVVHSLGLADSVESFETVDAGSYRICPDHSPDVIVVEVMRACLASEPQVAITRHLLPQAPEAILIPQEIRIDFVLLDPSREFDLDCQQQNSGAIRRDRIRVAPVFVVNREAVNAWAGNVSDRLPAASLQLPDLLDQRYQAMLLTVVRIYAKHVLQDYDSGLTCPRTPTIAGKVVPGATIQFHYRLGVHPQLIGEVC